MEKIKKVGAPAKEPRKMIPTMLSLTNIWRLNLLSDKLNTGPKKSISIDFRNGVWRCTSVVDGLGA